MRTKRGKWTHVEDIITMSRVSSFMHDKISFCPMEKINPSACGIWLSGSHSFDQWHVITNALVLVLLSTPFDEKMIDSGSWPFIQPWIYSLLVGLVGLNFLRQTKHVAFLIQVTTTEWSSSNWNVNDLSMQSSVISSITSKTNIFDDWK